MGRSEFLILQITRLEDRLEKLTLSHDDRVIIQRMIEELQGELLSCDRIVYADPFPVDQLWEITE